jgi:hypothetical protein
MSHLVNYFTRQYIPEDNSELHTRCRENLKSHLFKLAVFLSSLMMEAARTSETSVDNHFTRQYIPEDSAELHTRRRENLKSHLFKLAAFLSSPMMEAARTSETSVDNHFTRQYVPEDNSERLMSSLYTCLLCAKNMTCQTVMTLLLLSANPEKYPF